MGSVTIKRVLLTPLILYLLLLFYLASHTAWETSGRTIRFLVLESNSSR